MCPLLPSGGRATPMGGRSYTPASPRPATPRRQDRASPSVPQIACKRYSNVFVANSRFAGNILALGIWKNLSFRCPFSCSMLTSICLIFRHVTTARFIKKQLKSYRSAADYTLRTACIAESCGQSMSHARILSRYSS